MQKRWRLRRWRSVPARRGVRSDALWRGQAQVEHAALIRYAAKRDARPQRLRELTAQIEAKPGSFGAAGERKFGLAARAEQFRVIFGANADAGVFDGELDHAAPVFVTSLAETDFDAAGVGKLD